MSVVINTGEVPPAERFHLWADATPRVFEPLSVTPHGAAPFAGRVARYPLGPLTLFRLSADASSVTRTTAMIGESDPEWIQVALLLRGRCAIDQEGRQAMLTAGQFSSWASSRPYEVDAHTHHDLLVTYCPEVLLRPHSHGIYDRTATAIPGDEGTGRLVRRFLLALLAELETGRPVEGAHDVAEGLVDLFRGLYGGRVAPRRSLERAPDVLRTQIRTFIDANLADPGLAPDTIARAHFISRRYLDRLLEADGTSVRETIRERRLERCRRDLQDPRLADRPILEIAASWGFVSASHFSRSFRAAYGMAPRDAR